MVCGLSAGDVVDAVEEARAAAAKQSDGLDDFQLIPKDADGNAKLKGLDLLNHLCRVRNMRSAVDGTGRIEPSKSLNLEMQSDALKMIQPTLEEMRHGAVMRDSFGDRAQRKFAQRKLNSIGAIVGTCTVVNSEENMDKMRKELQFAEAMAEINRLDADDKAEEKKKKDDEFRDNAPAAAKKFEKDPIQVAKLIAKDIEALLYQVYNITLSGSKLRKPDYVKAQEKELDQDRTI